MGADMTVARVFPRRTKATPTDDYAFIGDPGLFVPDNIDEVHVSVAFTWDLPEAERLAASWSRIAPVKIGGPATGMRGEEFIPGRYLRPGYVITSRGCPNHCWFCSVYTREGELRELPINDGWNLTDDNILACSESHILAVFAMLSRQKERVQFTGGIEAKLLKPWHIELFKTVRPKQIFFAYDTPDDLSPLEEAARLFREAEYGSRSILRCYVLIGYPGDMFSVAEHRLKTAMRLGFGPMAMLYRDVSGVTTPEWRRFQSLWARPRKIYAKNTETEVSDS
ncbi:hypothetical protein AGMMS49957_01980 [Synergistales bacterium]|nr:hypothetical protein AGMMS49957_01980 [Synergistales bacterium]